MRLWIAALAIVAGGLGLMWLDGRSGVPLIRESRGEVRWIMAASATGAYLLFRVVAGRDGTNEFLLKLLTFFRRTK